MSIQAVRSNYIGDTDTNYSQVQCAIARWSSGEKVNPPRPWADFSADNWADSDERDPAKLLQIFPLTPAKETSRHRILSFLLTSLQLRIGRELSMPLCHLQRRVVV